MRGADVGDWSDGLITRGQASMEVGVSCALRNRTEQGDDGEIALLCCATKQAYMPLVR